MGDLSSGTAPLPEYPRPQMLRGSFQSLNGFWEYAVASQPTPPSRWEGKILVPFSPESPMSGVARALRPGETLWYKTAFTLPASFLQGRVLLHFGAVEHACTVFVSGLEAGRHKGGRLPFYFDITALLRDGAQELMVCASGESDAAPRARTQPGGGLHSPQCGIWQTVWLESVPHTYIRALTLTPLYDDAAVRIEVSSAGGPLSGQLDILAHKTLVKRVDFQSGQVLRVALPGFISWHPGRPFLYTLRVRGGQDAVESYFGMRKVHLAPDAAGCPRLMLNNKPFLCAGVVDWGLYPGGGCIAPSDKAMLDDLRFAKDCGFNIIRKQGKIEPMRWYSHCDRLGLLVWQDLPADSGSWRPRLWQRLLPAALRPGGRHLGWQNAAEREDYMHPAQEAAQMLYNTPSLVVWGLFQQGQGNPGAPNGAERLRQCDPTRLIDQTGGRHKQGGDIYGVQLTRRNARLLKKPAALRGSRAFFFTHAGGFAFPPGGSRRAPGRPCPTREVFAGAVVGLYRDYLLPLRENGLCGFFFYQLADAGDETSGLLPFGRTAPKLQAKGMAALNRLFLGQ